MITYIVSLAHVCNVGSRFAPPCPETLRKLPTAYLPHGDNAASNVQLRTASDLALYGMPSRVAIVNS